MNINQLRREAVLAAEDVLADLDLVDGTKIPIFDLIEDRGIWLSFQPLERLLGVYQRIGNVAGVAINVARPLAMQRFTAAHELGHHELGHESHVDDETSIEGSSNDPQELQAQTFAASLLMSEVAVEAHLERLGRDLRRPALDPLDIYSLSVELGVSYTAAITQLRTLSKVTQTTADTAYKLAPLTLKQMLLGGRRPDNARAAVWRLGLADNQRSISADVGDELDIALPEMLSTGYEWTPDGSDAFATVHDWIDEATADADAVVYGDRRTRHITIKARQQGDHTLGFRLAQPWPDGDTGATMQIHVHVAPAQVSDVGQGISVNQQPQLLAA